MKENYHLKMLDMIQKIPKNASPTLLLHTCCAPCSSTAICRLADFFHITVFYYNPNIEPYEEYILRKQEQQRFIREFQTKFPVSFLDCDWDNSNFLEMAKGMEMEKEGGKRCHSCYQLRLQKTAIKAKELGFDYFSTSLSVSPYKNSQILNQIGFSLEQKYGVSFLCADFKKENGYLEIILKSKEYHLYRQNYCGCHFSKSNLLNRNCVKLEVNK